MFFYHELREAEDIIFQIEYLTRGYKNRQANLYTHQKKTWQQGGCFQSGRTRDTTLKANTALTKKYPNYVFLNKPRDGISTLKCRWKQAYKDSQINSLWKI
jgi:hypothetical protein